jgi:hypothetical protein
LGADRTDENTTTKEKMRDLIGVQPDDATREEILRELAFAHTVERGLRDGREGRATP